MIPFRTGALRRAATRVPADRLAAATRLVQATLARHGLVDNAGMVTSPLEASGLGNALAPMPHNAQGPEGSGQIRPVADVSLPRNVRFTHHSFSCASGQRDYRLYVPAKAQSGATALVVMLHGCTQTPEDFAAGTGMNDLADTHGFLVVYPAQARGANAQSCWNWFGRGDQQRERGEPAIIAGLTRQIATEHKVPRERTFVAGLSAGGAMAVVLGETHADLFGGVGVHSGLPYGAARDVASAFAAMGGKPGQRSGSPRSTAPVRTIVFHGTADTTVHPINGELVARDAVAADIGANVQTIKSGVSTGRSFSRKITSDDNGRPSVEHWSINGLGHAWSGGQPTGSYTDPQGPDASAEMIRFFLDGDGRSF
jgi:poly(hydroxyalkanoate) depolymerase family esterase